MTSPAAPNFDRVARIYRWAEYLSLGPLLQRTRRHFLPQLTHVRRVLALGDGDGRFLAALLAQNPGTTAHAVDTSAQMLLLLARRCNTSRVTTQQASVLAIDAPHDTDLVTTHFLLDCLSQPEVEALAARLARQLQPSALWLVSDFRIPANALAPLARLYVRALYFAFRVLTGLRVVRLPDPQAALSRAGFTPIASHTRLCGILYTQLWQLRSDVLQSHLQETMSQPPHLVDDPVPDPEPASPSLGRPDPGVFHHEPGQPPASASPKPNHDKATE